MVNRWQERDFVLDVDKGTLSYFKKGFAGDPTEFKGELRLAGGMVAPWDKSLGGQKFVFELTSCVHEDGTETPLKLGAPSQHDREAWIIAIRATMKKHGAAGMRHVTALDDALTGRKALGLDRDMKEQQRLEAVEEAAHLRQEQMDHIEIEDVHQKQDLTLDAVGRIKAQLLDSQELANATGQTLTAQTEQIDAINEDLEKINHNVERADKNFDTLERWRIFGGKSRKKGKKAGKEQRKQISKDNEKFEDKVAAKKGDLGMEYDRSDSNDLDRDDLASSGPKHQNVAKGLKGRNAEEQAQIDAIAAKDDTINSGLDDIDKLLDVLGDTAKQLGDQTQKHNEKLKLMTGTTDEAQVGVARINERAQYNVRYLS